MNKYEKILSMMGRICGFSFFVIISIGLVGAITLPIFLVGMEMIPILFFFFELMLCCAIHFVSYAYGLFFAGDHYKPTGYVSRGQSLDWPVETRRYVKRNMITNLMEIITCSIFIIAYIVLLCLNLYHFLLITGLVCSIIAFIVFFLFYKKQQYQLKSYNTNHNENVSRKTITNKTVNQTTIFNFKKYPEMCKLYRAYKASQNVVINLMRYESNVELYNIECAKRDTLFEILAQNIYKTFNGKNPELINIRTKKIVLWRDLFGEDYNSLTMKQKDYMIRLLDKHPYRFLNEDFYNK